MKCQNCHQSLEAGAAFCGNCGQPVKRSVQALAMKAVAVPAYAVATPAQHSGEVKSLLSLLLGVIGIAGAFFMALAGLAFGVAGLVAGTLSRATPQKRLSTAGIVMSGLAVMTGLGIWVYAVSHDPRFTHQTVASGGSGVVMAASVDTPCYSVGFFDKFNVQNLDDSCDLVAYNGQTIESSTNAYKVYSHRSQINSVAEFTDSAKQAIEKDVKINLAGFDIVSQKVAAFAGSPAYVVNVFDQSRNVAVVEAAVLHKVGTGANIFILVHAANAKTADLQIMESQWQWK